MTLVYSSGCSAGSWLRVARLTYRKDYITNICSRHWRTGRGVPRTEDRKWNAQYLRQVCKGSQGKCRGRTREARQDGLQLSRAQSSR